ncbi:beta-propeller domain-containing protein [Mycoplasmatota bacterium zrk1]
MDNLELQLDNLRVENVEEFEGIGGIVSISNSEIVNQVAIFKTNSKTKEMELIGEIAGLGKPGERIKSARFENDMAYVVTFLRTDPLYAIDLSDPMNPMITAEIVETGFSTYMHVWDEKHTVGIGYSADESGRIKGMKISVYDVTGSTTKPFVTEYFSKVESVDSNGFVTKQWNFSEALHNHKAMLISSEKHLFGFPIELDGRELTIVNEEENWSSYTKSYYNLYVIDPDSENIISLLTQVDHTTENGVNAVDRGIYIDNHLITLSPSSIIVVDLDHPSEVKQILQR